MFRTFIVELDASVCEGKSASKNNVFVVSLHSTREKEGRVFRLVSAYSRNQLQAVSWDWQNIIISIDWESPVANLEIR